MAEDIITAAHLESIRGSGVAVAAPASCELADIGTASLKEIVHRGVAAIEYSVLTRVLEQTGGNKAEAARILRIDYKTIHTKLKGHGISARG